jgi:hypothetical protein
MTQSEWKKAFIELHAEYPGFSMPDPKIVERVYFDQLKNFSLEIFKRALPELLRMNPQFFPACGVVKSMCESAALMQDSQGHLPKRRFHPEDHGCKMVGKQEMSHARRLLFEVAPFEGYHVECSGEIHPVCPECGISQAPFVNPFISLLMKEYPSDTKDWSSLHKGTLLCHACEVIDGPYWVKKLYDRRAEARR